MLLKINIILMFVNFISATENLEEIPENATLIQKIPKMIQNVIYKIMFSNTCLSDLGCFFTGPPFYHPIYRPISVKPFELKDMKTKFWLFTPSSPVNSTNGTLLTTDIEAFSTSPFVKCLPVKFLIHGYLTTLEDKETDDRYVMKNALLKEGSYNVIIVDWTNSNGRPYYKAVANARVVGAQLAQMIKFLQENAGTNPENVHLIGHSLGAHISGWAGERTPHLGRISGLDPAGPFFRSGDNHIHLDDTDATFVDVIHSDEGSHIFGGLGINEAIGHLDFYPNGGSHQLGCRMTLLNITIAQVRLTLTGGGVGITSPLASPCDHSRSVQLYTATIDSSRCEFMGTQCESYEKFKKGKCKFGRKVRMGFHAKKDSNIPKGQKYYLRTGKKFPFCRKIRRPIPTKIIHE